MSVLPRQVLVTDDRIVQPGLSDCGCGCNGDCGGSQLGELGFGVYGSQQIAIPDCGFTGPLSFTSYPLKSMHWFPSGPLIINGVVIPSPTKYTDYRAVLNNHVYPYSDLRRCPIVKAFLTLMQDPVLRAEFEYYGGYSIAQTVADLRDSGTSSPYSATRIYKPIRAVTVGKLRYNGDYIQIKNNIPKIIYPAKAISAFMLVDRSTGQIFYQVQETAVLSNGPGGARVQAQPGMTLAQVLASGKLNFSFSSGGKQLRQFLMATAVVAAAFGAIAALSGTAATGVTATGATTTGATTTGATTAAATTAAPAVTTAAPAVTTTTAIATPTVTEAATGGGLLTTIKQGAQAVPSLLKEGTQAYQQLQPIYQAIKTGNAPPPPPAPAPAPVAPKKATGLQSILIPVGIGLAALFALK